MKKSVNGVLVDMSPEEEAAFLASLQRTVAQAKADARRAIVRRAKQEGDEESLLEHANPAARLVAVRQRARQLWQQVQACNSAAEVDAVDLNAGW